MNLEFYLNKYLKYKKKYLQLKNNLDSSNVNLIKSNNF
jgi:hypothetical protein